MKRSIPVCLAGFLLFLTSCSTAYYQTMEKAGIHKRDILVKRVARARDTQEAAKEQFVSALDELQSLTGFSGGELESRYRKLDAAYKRSKNKANAVRNRNNDVERVAGALFREWENEAEQFSNPTYRRDSLQKLAQSRRRYDSLIAAMRRAEARLDPVLVVFGDQVLYLKHNLNARAITSLRGELARVEVDVNTLVREMEHSIAEANAFIGTLH